MSTSPQLWMVRPHLDDIAEGRLPEGCALRSYQPGDAAHWSRIISEAFERAVEQCSFDEIMRRHPAFRPARIFFIVRGEQPVATASAWYKPEVMPDAGMVHYVAVVPAERGKKLGCWASVAALHRMASEGRKRAWLSTDDFRLAAIKTYLNLGFEPLLIHENHRERWRKVFASLGLSELCEQFAGFLEGPLWKVPEGVADDFDYENMCRRRRRWLPDRPAARPWPEEFDAMADESLYRPSLLGTACADAKSVPAGEDRAFDLRFRAGPAGIPEGAKVIFYTPGQHPLGTQPQVNDPQGPGFVQVSAPDGVQVEPLCTGFRLVGGSLSEGDEVRIAVGKTAGFPWTPLAGRKEFKVIIDVGRGEPEMRLPEPVVVRVLPREASRIDVFLPATALSSNAIRATVTVRDRFDNRVPYNGRVCLRACGTETDVHLQDGMGWANVGTLGPEAKRVELVEGPLPGRWRSNWCVPSAGLNLYVGDMHCHDFTCMAQGYTSDVYRWAMDDKRLDFVSVSVQCHAYLDNEKWLVAKHLAEAFLDEGRFVTFPAFEWQHSHYGDKVIHYLGGNMPPLPVDDPRYDHPTKLYEALRGTDALVISHHPGYALDLHVPGTDWDAVETDVDRLVELWSMHGSSEGYDPDDRPLHPPRRPEGVMAALKKGLRMGFVAGSDTHSGRPGGSASEPRAYWGGLCAVWAEALTRRALFEAFRARRTYALTGARIVLRFSVNDALMGSEIPSSHSYLLRAEVWASDRIKSVQLMRDGEVLHEETPLDEVCCVEFEDKPGKGAPPAAYHCRVTQQDGHLAVCSPVWVAAQ